MRRMTCSYRPKSSFRVISIHILHAEDDESGSKPANHEKNFNPHPPCGGWHQIPHVLEPDINFNPHPPCGGWPIAKEDNADSGKFQSTSSMRRMTNPCCPYCKYQHISIHILHAEDDKEQSEHKTALHNFNPHPPCGGWRAVVEWHQRRCNISIHILHAEDDLVWWQATETLPDFNPHPPCGGWLKMEAMGLEPMYFNPHPPCGGWRKWYAT